MLSPKATDFLLHLRHAHLHARPFHPLAGPTSSNLPVVLIHGTFWPHAELSGGHRRHENRSRLSWLTGRLLAPWIVVRFVCRVRLLAALCFLKSRR